MRRSFGSIFRQLSNGCGLRQVRMLQATSWSRDTADSSQWRPELVVIDHYGTLFNIHAAWEPWLAGICHRLEQVTGLPLLPQVYQSLNVCQFTRRVRHGMLGCGTSRQIKRTLQTLLEREGLSRDAAARVLAHSWHDYSPSHDVKHLHETRQILEDIKGTGAKIAVCSSADRRSTIQTLEHSDLTGLVDHVTCGDDASVKVGSRVTAICAALGVAAKDTVVIGDGVCDMEMGREAGVALNIGVLSGASTRLNLTGVADIVTDDISCARDVLIGLNGLQLEDIKTKRHQTSTNKSASLVIFDKDGTLLCFHSAWTPYINEYIERLEAATGLDLKDKVLHCLGYCVKRDKWRPAVFTEGTTQQSKEAVADMLVLDGYDRRRAMAIADSTWPGSQARSNSTPIKAFDYPAAIFSTLRARGIRVAVCTSDCRHSTERFLGQQNALDLVDVVVCGDDTHSIPKPSGHNALYICQQLKVNPAKAVIVGDTSADMVMGRQAKLGANIAVLTGVGDLDHLSPDADHVIPSVSHLFDVVTENGRQARAEYEARVRDENRSRL